MNLTRRKFFTLLGATALTPLVAKAAPTQFPWREPLGKSA